LTSAGFRPRRLKGRKVDLDQRLWRRGTIMTEEGIAVVAVAVVVAILIYFLVLVVILFFVTVIVGALLAMRALTTTQRDGGWVSYGNGCPVRRS